MKIRRLLEVDLARLTCLPADEQVHRMTAMVKGRGGIFSFAPLRDQLKEILNVQPPMFGHSSPVRIPDFSEIEKVLVKQCKRGTELVLNLQVARMLFEHFRSRHVVSRGHDFGRLPFGLDRGLIYWVSSFYGRNGRPVVSFIDPRGGHGLTDAARSVVFSVMHIAIRERDPDFAKAELEIIQLPYAAKGLRQTNGEKPRTLQVHEQVGSPKFSFSDLDAMFTQTLRLWDAVNAEATASRRRAGGRGTLL